MFTDLRERDRERETLKGWLPPTHAQTRDWIHNLGMCPDWESNLQPFGVWSDYPTNLATQLGQEIFIID